MDPVMWSPKNRRPRPPPLWLVTNGEITVGPVNTDRLVRGVLARKVPETCWVRPSLERGWRPLDEVREVRAIAGCAHPARPQTRADVQTLEALLGLSDEPNDALLLSLELAKKKLGASVAMLHCFEGSRGSMVTRFASGLGADARIGARVSSSDSLVNVARTGRGALGEPSTEHAFQDAANRLGGDAGAVHGVGMVPIVRSSRVLAMLEVGRADHAFRAADFLALRDVSRRASSKLSALS